MRVQYMTREIVYEATVAGRSTAITKHYIGMASRTFKARYHNHFESFQHEKCASETVKKKQSPAYHD